MRPVFTDSVGKDCPCLLYECGQEVLRGSRRRRRTSRSARWSPAATASGAVRARQRRLDQPDPGPGHTRLTASASPRATRAPTAPNRLSPTGSAAGPRADDHSCSSLHGYTCAAVPVLAPVTGELPGRPRNRKVRSRDHLLPSSYRAGQRIHLRCGGSKRSAASTLTTCSRPSSALLLRRPAQAPTGNTTALMPTRGAGPQGPAGAAGQGVPGVTRAGPGGRRALAFCARWSDAVAEAHTATARSRLLTVVGEPDADKAVLALLARRDLTPREARPARPPAADTDVWSTL
jgi:sigma-54 dependent transcriptional regulator, acetoin dehydrogenase operon transcriptional activator AcoR